MTQLHGNTTGLSPSATRTLERIYRRRVPLHQIATPELVRSLCDASRETGRQVGALVHRSGQVEYVVVGDASRLMLPDVGRFRGAEGRLRGLRLVHTHLHGERVTKDDIVDLVRLRLDLVCALQLAPDAEVRAISYAHNVPSVRPGDAPYREVGPIHPTQLDVDFGALVGSLEAEFARQARLRPVVAKDGRAVLAVVSDKADRELRLDERIHEMHELARTAGVDVVDTIVLVRDRLDPKFVFGKGKLDDVVLRAAELAIGCAVKLARHQIRNVWVMGNHDAVEDGSGRSTLSPRSFDDSRASASWSPRDRAPSPRSRRG
jgi:GTP-binding protein HflX